MLLAAVCFAGAWLVPSPKLLAGRPRAASRRAATVDMLQLRKPLREPPATSRAKQPQSQPRPQSQPPLQGWLEQARNAAARGNTTGAVDLALLALDSPPANQNAHLVRGCNKLLALLGDRGELGAMEQLYGAMRRSPLQPTQVTFGTLISRCGSAKPPAPR